MRCRRRAADDSSTSPPSIAASPSLPAATPSGASISKSDVSLSRPPSRGPPRGRWRPTGVQRGAPPTRSLLVCDGPIVAAASTQSRATTGRGKGLVGKARLGLQQLQPMVGDDLRVGRRSCPAAESATLTITLPAEAARDVTVTWSRAAGFASSCTCTSACKLQSEWTRPDASTETKLGRVDDQTYRPEPPTAVRRKSWSGGRKSIESRKLSRRMRSGSRRPGRPGTPRGRDRTRRPSASA